MQSTWFSTDKWKYIIRARFSCTESPILCRHIVICVQASDCPEKQKKILRQLEKECSPVAGVATTVETLQRPPFLSQQMPHTFTLILTSLQQPPLLNGTTIKTCSSCQNNPWTKAS